jgi:hypothetical protein
MQTRGSLTVLQRTTAVTLKSKLACVLAASFSFSAMSAQGATMLSAELTTTQEPPPINLTNGTGGTRPTPSGFATFVLNDAMTALTFSATIFNIDVNGFVTPGTAQTPYATDDLRAAHIHAGTAIPPATNPVVWGFFGMPFNDTTPNDFLFTPFATGVGGTFSGKWDLPEGNATTLTAQIPNILAGRSYINFHTTENPGGEIRGLIQVVPEPGTMFLFAAGLLGFAGARRFAGRR